MIAQQTHMLVQRMAQSQESALMPRLQRATDMLECAMYELGTSHKRAARIAKRLCAHKDLDRSVLMDAVAAERLAGLAFESARIARTELRGADSMKGLAGALPSVISVIRASGSLAHSVESETGSRLFEAASMLGSIAIDAALIEGTQVRYGACASHSTDMLERAKLIVDSKLSKLHPKLDLRLLESAWV